MHYYEKNIVDIKNIYTDFLVNMMSPLVYEGIKSIYNKSLMVEQDYQKAMLEDEKITNPGILKIFQHFLKGVPSLNSNLIENEMIRIRDSSKNADIFEKIIRAVFKSYIILLTYNASGKECTIVKDKFHERINIIDFIHKIYIESAKQFYNNPELFWHNYSSIDIKKNQSICIEIIKNSIKEAILKVLPLNDILTEYLRNDYIQDNSINEIRNMLDKDEVINHYDGGSIIDPEDNGIQENNNQNIDDNQEINDRNNLLNELNQINNNQEELILNQASLINSQDNKELKQSLNTSEEYQEKLNSLGGAFYNKQTHANKLASISNKDINKEINKINIVKPNIIE